MFYDRDELTRMSGSCFKDFPYECEGCNYYKEKASELSQFTFLFFSTEIPSAILTKVCTIYHKKVTEKLK